MRYEGVFIMGGIRDVDAFDGVVVGEHVDDGFEYRGFVEWGLRAADVLETPRVALRFLDFADDVGQRLRDQLEDSRPVGVALDSVEGHERVRDHEQRVIRAVPRAVIAPHHPVGQGDDATVGILTDSRRHP
jgi:hypothetical protein